MTLNKFLAVFSMLALVNPASATPLAVDNGLMTEVPNFGPSRVETVSFCLSEAGVEKYQDLMTDSQWGTFADCLIENT